MGASTDKIRLASRLFEPELRDGTREPEPAAVVPGPRLGRYRLEEPLGSRTWRAEDTKDGRPVLVRVAGPASIAKLFARRNREIAKIPHPVFLPWSRLALCGGWVVAARKFLTGYPRKETPENAYMLAQAVEHLHEHGIPHGAIEPEKVLFDRTGTPVLVGFAPEGDVTQDVLDLTRLLSSWVNLEKSLYLAAGEIAEELRKNLTRTLTTRGGGRGRPSKR